MIGDSVIDRPRARDSAGNVQPLAADWTLGGYANTSIQRVPVSVR